jgi:hypothetical protein
MSALKPELMRPEDLEALDVPTLQKRLSGLERLYEPMRKPGQRDEARWEAISAAASQCRARLFNLTGDSYGRPKVKVARPSDDALGATYESPDEIPGPLMQWALRNLGLLTSDGTDLVRWSRIINTLDDDRLEAGTVTLYRAVDGDEIRPGDWVTTLESYAQMHLTCHLKGRGQVVQLHVDGQDVLLSPTGNEEELIYAPRDLSGPHQPTVAPTPVSQSGNRKRPRP